ncbi:M15 family metallopeptidase [Planococcus lenghuensis]|uniref:Peptidase n=1 Tax=Planococcus lenghuensis TaxID=2213202 RepID=A0A1Q2KV93_9BACL|nr:M15 family metallopeptidase [Planococcus lenghuensis]AQQ52034.1 peptidase [Planococcus lenghuensis]
MHVKWKKLALWLLIAAIVLVLAVWIQRELAFREELRARPLPTALHPEVAEKSDELIRRAAAIGIDAVVTEGFRSAERQNELYAQGRTTEGSIVTQVEGGGSYHNYGLAIDFALLEEDGDISWDLERDANANGEPDWFEVAAIGKDLGFEWGGDWRRFKDYPHLELTYGLSIRELKNGWRPEDVME